MDLRRKGGRILNPFWISVGSYSIRSIHISKTSSNRMRCWFNKRDTIRRSQCITGYNYFSLPDCSDLRISSERTSWSWNVPSYQRLNSRQASFTIGQEIARPISFIGGLGSSLRHPAGILAFREDPKCSQWYLRILSTQVQPWSCVCDLEKQYIGESRACSKCRTGTGWYCCQWSRGIYRSSWTSIWQLWYVGLVLEYSHLE